MQKCKEAKSNYIIGVPRKLIQNNKNVIITAKKVLMSEYFVLYLSLIFFAVLAPFVPRFASLENIGNIFSNMWPLLCVAAGQTIVLIIAGIDLSQTSVIAFTSVIGSVFMTQNVNPDIFSKSPLWGWFLSQSGGPLAGRGYAVICSILIMIATGCLIGFLNGVFIAHFSMPPFMVTLVSQMFFGAFAIYLTKSENVMGLPKSFISLGNDELLFIPYSFIIAVLLCILAHFILNFTVLGRYLYAVGTNVKASVVSGIPSKKVIIFAYVFSGFCATIGSILYSSRLQMGRPTMGSNILMDIVGATVIGGTSMFGGKGKVIWTVFGVFFFVLLANALNLLNLSYFTINIVKGAIILLAALFDVMRTRIFASEHGK